jgi:hypothetical protein
MLGTLLQFESSLAQKCLQDFYIESDFCLYRHISLSGTMEDPIDWGVGCDSHDHSDTETTSPSSTTPAAPPSAKAAPNVDGAVDAEQDTCQRSPQNSDEDAADADQDTYRGSPQNFVEDAAGAEKNTYQQSPQSFDEAHEQGHIPLGEPLPRSMNLL